jgi:hypothetical protein
VAERQAAAKGRSAPPKPKRWYGGAVHKVWKQVHKMWPPVLVIAFIMMLALAYSVGGDHPAKAQRRL